MNDKLNTAVELADGKLGGILNDLVARHDEITRMLMAGGDIDKAGEFSLMLINKLGERYHACRMLHRKRFGKGA